MSAGDRDTLALVLAEHGRWTAGWEDHGVCICGLRFPRAGFGMSIEKALAAHVADVLLASDWLREQRTEAWKAGHGWCDGICYGTNDHPNPYCTTEDTDG